MLRQDDTNISYLLEEQGHQDADMVAPSTFSQSDATLAYNVHVQDVQDHDMHR